MDFSLQLGPSSCDLVMMLPECSHTHITRKRGIYYYRRRVPGRPSREIAVSLRTRRLSEARWLASELDREFERIIASVSENKKPADVQAIALQYLKRKLDWDMELRISSPHVGAFSRSTEPGSMVEEELGWVDGELATARTEFLERCYDHQRPLIGELMARHGVPK